MRLVEVATATSIGGRPEMQDELLVVRANERALLAVADGHGEHGAAFAYMVCEGLRSVAASGLDTPLPLAERAFGLKQALINVHNAHIHKYEYVYDGGGSTVTSVIVDGAAVATAQLGDSGAVYYPDGKPGGERLTVLHTPGNRSEAKRIRKIGWKVHRDEHGVSRVGGMMITGAVGSYTEPFLRHDAQLEHHLLQRPGFLVVGTDGLLGIDMGNRAAIGQRLNYYQKGQLPITSMAHLLIRDFASGDAADNAAVILGRFE